MYILFLFLASIICENCSTYDFESQPCSALDSAAVSGPSGSAKLARRLLS